jgi:hypothetical protein
VNIQNYNNIAISFIVCTMDNYDDLDATLRSLKNNLIIGDQICIVDGSHSRESLLNIINRSGIDRSFIKHIHAPAKGVYNAINIGIKRAINCWIHVLHSGDLMLENSLKIVRSSLLDGHDLYICNQRYGPSVNSSALLISSKHSKIFPHQSIIYRANLHINFGYYNEDNLLSSDQLFFRKISDVASVKYLQVALTFYNTNGISSIYNREAFINEWRLASSFNMRFLLIFKTIFKYSFSIESVHKLRRFKNYIKERF